MDVLSSGASFGSPWVGRNGPNQTQSAQSPEAYLKLEFRKPSRTIDRDAIKRQINLLNTQTQKDECLICGM